MPKRRVSPPNQIWFETNLDIGKTLESLNQSRRVSYIHDTSKGYFVLELNEYKGNLILIYIQSKKIKIFYPNIETLEKMYEILSSLILKANGSKADWSLKRDQLQKLAFEIGSLFKLFWGKAIVEIDKKDFFESIQQPIKLHLNEKLSLDEPNVQFYDPIIDLYSYDARCLYEDAKLAKLEGHFLTANHRDILMKIDGLKEKEVIEHNRNWAKRLEEGLLSQEIESWIEFFGPNPSGVVIHELFLRRKILEEKCMAYYKRFDRGEFTLHDVYDEDEKWSFDTEKAKLNRRNAKGV